MHSTSRWLNCFQYCAKALQILGSVMCLLVTGIVGLVWFAVFAWYGPLMLGPSILKALGGAVVFVMFTGMCGMILWAYFAAVSTNPGQVPAGWHPFADEQQAQSELERLAYSDYYFDRRDPRRPRFCKRCQAWKPERAHHCSVSGHCVLKMDHYCVWVINCVGLLNYKFFLLFLFYTMVGSLTAFLLLIHPVIRFLKGQLFGPSAPIIFVSFVVTFAFTIAVAGFIIMHLQMLDANCTTIEMYEKDRIHPWPYNKGFRRNFEEVFGRSKLRWLLPLHTKEEKRLMLDSCLKPLNQASHQRLTSHHASSAAV